MGGRYLGNLREAYRVPCRRLLGSRSEFHSVTQYVIDVFSISPNCLFHAT